MALATFVYNDTGSAADAARRRPLFQTFRPVSATPPGYQVMVDSAWPLSNPPRADITLIYIGGDTPHAWRVTEVQAAAQRTPLLWPCWVRSNPGSVNATSDANAAVASLRAYGVPSGVSVILDLETAVNTAYVNTFNTVLGNAGYGVTKYGSSGFIWDNPKTSAGTFVAAPGISAPVTIGDAVATQYMFAGSFDLTWVKDGVALWEAGAVAITDADVAKIAAAVGANVVDSTSGATMNGVLRRTDRALPTLLAAAGQPGGGSVDPAAIASAVVADLEAAGLSADQIAQHVLAGLSTDLAQQVVLAMGAKLSS